MGRRTHITTINGIDSVEQDEVLTLLSADLCESVHIRASLTVDAPVDWVRCSKAALRRHIKSYKLSAVFPVDVRYTRESGGTRYALYVG